MKYATHYQQFTKLTAERRDSTARELASMVSDCLQRTSKLSPRRGLPALDIGSGSCVGVRSLQLMGLDAVGLDCDEELVALGRHEGFEVHHCCEPIEFLNTRPGYFEVIVMRDVLEHFDEAVAERLLSSCYFSLRPGGFVVIATPNGFSPLASVMRYIDFTHFFSSTPMSITPLLLDVGFAEVAIHPTEWSFWRSSGKALWRSESRRAFVRWVLRHAWRLQVWAELGIDPKRSGIPVDLNLVLVATRGQ